MRTIDRMLGKPLCAAASALDFLRGPFGRRGGAVRNILIIKLSELGSIVCAYPLLKDLKRRYPGCRIFFLTFSRNRPVFRFLGGLVEEQDVITLREGSFHGLAMDTWRALAAIRARRMDAVIDLEFFSRFTALISYASGAPVRAGFHRYAFEGLYRGELLTHKVAFNPLCHVIDTFRSFASCIDAPRKDGQGFSEKPEGAGEFPRYVSDPQTRARVSRMLADAGIAPDAGIVLCNPGEGVLPEREWPLENFIELGRRVLTVSGTVLVVAGTEGARRKAELFVTGVADSRCVNLAGKTKLDELLELMAMARALISNDCGLGHLSMLTACPGFILFGPESPRIFGPRTSRSRVFYSGWPCSPCLSVFNHRLSRCRDNRCLKEISVEEVWAAVRDSV